MARALANEFAKMRRLRIVPVAVVLVIGVVALTCIELTNPGFMTSVGDPAGQPWERLLVGLTFGVPMLSPILLAVLANRPVDIEHQGNGWLFSRTSGMTPGYLCRDQVRGDRRGGPWRPPWRRAAWCSCWAS